MKKTVFSFQFSVFSCLWIVAACLALLCIPQPGAAEDKKATDNGKETTEDVQDFVFLGESRPVLIRLHVHIDGKSVQAAWDECLDYLFKYLDVNNEGVLSKDELERGPSADQFNGSSGGGFPGVGRGNAPANLKMETVDVNKNGKVTRAELAAYYRKNGFTPFQFNFSSGSQNPLGLYASLFGGSKPEPSVDAVSKAIFDHLDTNQSGKLSLKELQAAEAVLLKLDENEDELVTTREIAPAVNANFNQLGALMAMGATKSKATSSPLMVPVLSASEVPADLVSRMMERYGPKVENAEKKLTRKDLGLDEATFRGLDTNGDGVLDAKELTGFVKRTPDIELILNMGKKKDAEARISVDGRSPLAAKFKVADGFLDLGLTRAEVRPNDQEGADRSVLMRQDYLIQFRQADTNNDGVVDETEAKTNPRLNRLFKVMDRDGDGKLTEKKLTAYFDHLQELQKRVEAGSVTLSISDQSRGLFDLLDTNRDGRLSVREMRQAPKLLKQLDRDNKGFLTREDMPRTYRLELRRGAINLGDGGGLSAFADLYSGSYEYEADQSQKGPLWFRRMDRNRDGDVSRKEWLFSEELFRQIDTDGDGLISVEEAEKADALFRKAAEKK